MQTRGTERQDNRGQEIPKGQMRSDGTAHDPPSATTGNHAAARRGSTSAAIAVLLAGLAITAAAFVTTRVIYNRNENRLLGLRVSDAGATIAQRLPGIETPLAAAAELATATHGDAAQFRQLLAPSVGGTSNVVSASLWTLNGSGAVLDTTIGEAPAIASDRALANATFSRLEKRSVLEVVAVPAPGGERIGYAYAPRDSRYLVYEENALPADRQSRVASNSSFDNLGYAIYLDHERPSDLLTTDEPTLPIVGRRASVSIPFGSSAFVLVMTPTASLGGNFFASLPWIVALVGTLISIAAALLVRSLERRRTLAEEIAGERDRVATENRRLYNEQRTIAETLQHALLPAKLPALPGIEISARYLPGVRGIEIGGDWYDVVKVNERRVLLVVGDVSGRGLRAATVMAELRCAAAPTSPRGTPPPRSWTG